MSRLSRISEEGLAQEKNGHCEDAYSEEGPMCRECEYRQQRWFRHSVATPWIISIALLSLCIALELSIAPSQAGNLGGYWKVTDFGEVACLNFPFVCDTRWIQVEDLDAWGIETVEKEISSYITYSPIYCRAPIC